MTTTPQVVSLITAAASALVGVLAIYFPKAVPDNAAGALVAACTALAALGVYLFTVLRHTTPTTATKSTKS